ncbi:AI-2E family transporter [Saliphagus sp. GCM10025308]
MQRDREFGRRIAVGSIVAALFLVVAHVALSFLGVLVFAVFLYYAVRPIYRALARFNVPRRPRAILALVLFGVPFLVLITYTVAVIVIETQALLTAYDVQDQFLEQVVTDIDVTGLDLDEIRRIVTDLSSQASLGVVVLSLAGTVSVVSGAVVQLIIMVTLVYYMLIDGPRFVSWALETYDESGVMRAYARAVDPELSMTLFGNIVNVFVTAIVGVVTFYTYNFFAPAAVDVPFPALIGALTGIGSLIPVVGIKLVYVPVIVLLAVNAWAAGDLSLLVPVGALAAVSAVLVDFIPDFFIRAHISGKQTHTGMLLVSYIVGPLVFGFYGLFLAPILLILVINAIYILLPYVLTGQPSGFDRPGSPSTVTDDPRLRALKEPRHRRSNEPRPNQPSRAKGHPITGNDPFDRSGVQTRDTHANRLAASYLGLARVYSLLLECGVARAQRARRRANPANAAPFESSEHDATFEPAGDPHHVDTAATRSIRPPNTPDTSGDGDGDDHARHRSGWPIVSAAGAAVLYVGFALLALAFGVETVPALLGLAVALLGGGLLLTGLFGWFRQAFLRHQDRSVADPEARRAYVTTMILFLATDLGTFGAGFIYYAFVRVGTWPPPTSRRYSVPSSRSTPRSWSSVASRSTSPTTSSSADVTGRSSAFSA